MATNPARPVGVNHLVLNVRDIEASHRFWTEIVGFDQCGEFTASPGMIMRFYNGVEGRHHDLALCQVKDPSACDEPGQWRLGARQPGLGHVAVGYPDREAFLAQLEHLAANDVPILLRGDHGMTHSAYISDPDGHGIELLYELPREVWENDVDAALNYFKPLPKEGPESLQDNPDYKVFG